MTHGSNAQAVQTLKRFKLLIKYVEGAGSLGNVVPQC
jgi:hypothetical protein